MQPVLVEQASSRKAVYPFAELRPVCDLLVGMLSIRQKWEIITGTSLPLVCESEWRTQYADSGQYIAIPSHLLPGVPDMAEVADFLSGRRKDFPTDCRLLQSPVDILRWNEWAIRCDLQRILPKADLMEHPAHVRMTEPAQVFVETGAVLEHCSIHAGAGPVYISRKAHVMDGAMLRGPLYLGEGSVVKMGARIYGASSFGPGCVIGGEVKNSLFMGYSNMAHEGYLGDSILGQWCNLGAGTTASNVKNSGEQVKVWSKESGGPVSAGEKCGVLMGDFCRTAIHTSFNTGTVTGICCNIFLEGKLSPYYLPDFSWGGGDDKRYVLDKLLSELQTWMTWKGQVMPPSMAERITQIYLDQNKPT